MAKIRKQIRIRRGRSAPLPSAGTAPSNIATSGNHDDKSIHSSTIPILKKLSALDVDDRAWTASAIAHLVAENQQTRRCLLANNLIGELSNAMADPNPEVAVEVIGALRNLLLNDEVAILEEMIQKNVLDLLLSHLNRIAQAVVPNQQEANTVTGEKAVPLYRLGEQCLLLLLSFIEFSEACFLTTASSLPILNFIVYSSFPTNKIPIPVMIASLQCLSVITDDTESPLASSLHESHLDLITSLMDIASNGSHGFNVFDDENRMMVRVLAANLVYNVAVAKNSKTQVLSSAVLPTVMSTLSSFDVARVLIKAADLEKELQVNVVSHPFTEKCRGGASDSIESNTDATMGGEGESYIEELSASGKVLKAQNAISILESHFLTIHHALELLANALGDDGNPGSSWEDIGEGQSDEDDMAMVDNEEIVEDDTADFIRQFLTQSAPSLFPLLAPICQLGVSPSCITSSVQGTRIRALTCLETLTMGVDSSWFATRSIEEVTLMWSWLMDIANNASDGTGESNNADIESLEGCVGIMWAMCRGLSESNVHIVYTDQQLDALISLCTNSNNPSSLIIKSLHVLSLLVSRPSHAPQNRKVGLLLLALVGGFSSPETVFEALDAIFDVYSDAAFDYDGPVFVGMGFLKRLKDSVEVIKSKVKSVDRKKDKVLYARGKEALENLKAFIQYKESERS